MSVPTPQFPAPPSRFHTSRPCFLCLIGFLFLLTSPSARSLPLALRIVTNHQARAVIVLGDRPAEEERYAAQELQGFLERYTGVSLPIQRGTSDRPQWGIHLGTPESHPLVAVWKDQLEPLGEEGYLLQSVESFQGSQLLVAGNTPRAVIYGTYALLEACVHQITGREPASPDFDVPQAEDLTIPPLSRVGRPFFPLRVSLAPMEPDWLSRHRFNVSGAEGVWTGTGSDDGLGTAVKYLRDPRFDELQDEPLEIRLERIDRLHRRLQEMRRRGIDTYLFMYVTGEGTEAMARQHPEWFGPPVHYRDARNHDFYRPFRWANPEVRRFFRELLAALLREYPELTGFHFRSWGQETRAAPWELEGGSPEGQQELLWDLYFDLIDAARQIRPDVRFYISGYNRHWLQDPDYSHLARLPQGTILTQKWGFDGEPTADVGLSLEELDAIGNAGQQIVVLSHNVEEVVPFWMVEADLFVAGVRRYIDRPQARALAGFTLQGMEGLGAIDQIVSGFIDWDPRGDYVRYVENYLALRYGAEAAPFILQAVRLNAQALATNFEHYAFTLKLSGAYGAGSSGTAGRFWSIIGADSVEDTLTIPEFHWVDKAHTTLAQLVDFQAEARAAMEAAAPHLSDLSDEARVEYEDGRALMELWDAFFTSRQALADAVWLGWTGGSAEDVRRKLVEGLAASRAMADPIRRYQQFFLLFGYTPKAMQRLLLDELAEEWQALERFDWHALDRSPPEVRLSVPESDGWFTTRDLELHIEAQDPFSGLAPGAQMQFQEDASDWSPPEPYAVRKRWRLSPRDGLHQIFVKVSDRLGNWSLPVLVEVLLDTTPPYGSIRPADPSPIQNERTTLLHINAFDAMSRMGPGSQIRLSHDGIHWQDPIPYEPLVPWEWTPGDGKKRVYALFRDSAGNWMQTPVSAEITLDTQAPRLVETRPATGATDVDFRIPTIELRFSEPLRMRETPEVIVIGSQSGSIPVEAVLHGDRIHVRLGERLAPGEEVRVSVRTPIRDALRNILASQPHFTFETAAALLPGDANRDGRVDANDIEVLLRHWGKRGPSRAPGGWHVWDAQPVASWEEEAAAYADTNGDGRVDAFDILPIAVHWGRSRPWAPGEANWQIRVAGHEDTYGQMLEALESSLSTSSRGDWLKRAIEAALRPTGPPLPQTRILRPFPNPFSSRVWFPFQLAEPADVSVRIFDARGRWIRTLYFHQVAPGWHDRPGSAPHWDGRNDVGERLASGRYWYRMDVGEQRQVGWIVLRR